MIEEPPLLPSSESSLQERVRLNPSNSANKIIIFIPRLSQVVSKNFIYEFYKLVLRI